MLERTVAAKDAKCRQLIADHEAERATWQLQLEGAQARDGSPIGFAPSATDR